MISSLIFTVMIFSLVGVAFAEESTNNTESVITMDVTTSGSDKILVSGKTISNITDVTFRVISPSGDSVVAIVQVSPDSNGNFSTQFSVGPVWSENGFYTIEARQPVVQNSLYPVTAQVEVNNGIVASCVDCSLEEVRMIANEILANNSPVSIWTDKTDYSHNDTIMVNGKVQNIISEYPVTITVISPLNSIVTIDKLKISNDGSFETTLNTSGNMWKYDGTYTIKTNYGGIEQSNSVKFVLSGGVEYTPNYSTPQPPNEFTVNSNRNSYTFGETINISGNVGQLADYSQKVTILVVSPDGNIVSMASVIPSSDGNYSHSLKAGGTMNTSGNYEVRAQYGSAKTTSTFIFTADGSATPEPTPEPEPTCGVGTIYDSATNSCVLIDENIDENTTQIKKENTKLKLENRQLKQQITQLEMEIEELTELLINGLKEIYNWKSNN